MAAKKYPKVYIVRHGPTEWSINGRHTGTTDLPLTKGGEESVRRSAPFLVGPSRILDPSLLQKAFISPRLRAQHTFNILFDEQSNKPQTETVEDVREWTYGNYEGLYKEEVTKLRQQLNLPVGKDGWNIWAEGCENGESPEEMTIRTDRVVEKVKTLHRQWYEDESRTGGGDILIVTHGHFSRCFIARWLGLPLEAGRLFVIDTGSVTVGQYYHSLDNTTLAGLNIGGS